MYNNGNLKDYMFMYLYSISEIFQYADSDVIKNVMNTFIEYYSCIVQAAFGDEIVFMCGTVITPFNYITGQNQPDRMNQWIAKEIYGVQSFCGQDVFIDIKALIERFLDFAKSAGLNITNESQNGNDNSSDGGQDSDDENEKFNSILG